MYVKALARPPHLKDITDIYPTILKFLYNRNILSINDFKQNYNTNRLSRPSSVFDIRNVSKVLMAWLKAYKRIVIYGDYDADGILSSFILYDFIHNILGYKKVWVWLPSRFLDGYGLNDKNLTIISKIADAVITVDCGIRDHDLVEKFKNKLEFIIIDHHSLPLKLPKAPIIHLQYNNSNSFSEVSAGFTALKFVSFLSKFLNLNNIKYIEDHIQKYFEYASLTLITDVMPMINENRRLLRLTLKLINSSLSNGNRTGAYWNKTDYQYFVSKFLEFLKNKQSFLNYKDFGFVIGPRLNAVGRIMDPNIAFSSVVVPDNYKFSILDKINTVRRDLIKDLKQEDFEIFLHNDNLILGYSSTLSEGIIGLVAGNYSKDYQKLSIFCTNDQDGFIKCSGRSPNSISIINILNKVQDKFNCFSKYGGHTNAAGLSLKHKVNINSFWLYLNDVFKGYKTNLDNMFIMVDDVLTPATFSPQLILHLKEFEPFGPKNEEYKVVLWGEVSSIKEYNNNKLILTISDFYDSNKLIDVYLYTKPNNFSIGSKIFILGTGAVTSAGRAIFFGQKIIDRVGFILN